MAIGTTLTRMAEGVGIALDSVRASKVRAFLTILGVAIGVMVVIAIGSAITGINRSVTGMLESAGPKTFFVFRFFRDGIQISDGSDELSPWRKNPWLTVEEAELIRKLPSIRDVSVSEGTSGPVSYGTKDLSGINIAGFGPSWVLVTGGELRAKLRHPLCDRGIDHRRHHCRRSAGALRDPPRSQRVAERPRRSRREGPAVPGA